MLGSSTLIVATVLPLACWRLTTTLSIVDSVAEVELGSFEAWGGHLTLSLALDVHPGRLGPTVDALRPYTFTILLLATTAALVLTALAALILARLMRALLGPRDEDSASAGQLGGVTSCVSRTQHLLSERQMELAALQSKAQHLDEEIRRAARDVDARQCRLRTAEATHAQLAEREQAGASALELARGASPTTGSSSLAGSSPTSATFADAGSALFADTAAGCGFAAPHKGTEGPALFGRSCPGGAPGSPRGLGCSAGLQLGAAALEDGWELDSPELDRFARLLGLSCGVARAAVSSSDAAAPRSRQLGD